MSNTAKTKLKIPTQALPEGWKKLGAEEFSVTESMIEKVVYGITEHLEIFKFMLKLAEKEKERRAKEKEQLQSRVQALSH